MDSLTRFLTRKLKRVVNEHKSRVAKTNDCEFLGFTFRGAKLRWSEQAFNEWLKRQGLIGVRDWWMKAHGYA